MKKITSIDELMRELEVGDHAYYGLRAATHHDLDNIERGYLDCSFDWVDGEKTDHQLNGTCAIGISDSLSESEIMRRYNNLAMYHAAHGTGTVLLIAEGDCEYGEDENEVILGHNGYGADVVAIVEL